MKNKKGFTLVELLAVIVILAVILVIAIPQIMNTIKTARISSFKDSAILIAEQAEKDYLSQQVLNQDYNATSIDCSDVAKLNDDYSYCNVIYENGKAKVRLLGSENGKYSGILCNGEKDNIICRENIYGYTNAVEYLINKNTVNNSDGLVTDEYGDIRYQGSNDAVKNYVYFNCNDMNNPNIDTCELWRIVGIFNVDGKNRIKLIRNESLGNYAWDTNIEFREGINQWGESLYRNGDLYEGADLMRELNGDYLNTTLTENPIWYSGLSNGRSATFSKNKVLKIDSQNLIGNATWYLGSSNTYIGSLDIQYKNERGLGSNGFQHVTNTNDEVIRKDTWYGKVGLIYPSDYGYASSNDTCKEDLYYRSLKGCEVDNWLSFIKSSHSLSPSMYNRHSALVCGLDGNGGLYPDDHTYYARAVYPSVYLLPEILIKGDGTQSNPYIFA